MLNTSTANSFPCRFQGSEEKKGKYARRVEEGEFNCLDVLPYVRLRVDYTHVRLFCTTVYEHPVVLMQKRMPSIVLRVCIRDKYDKTRETSSRVIVDPWLHFLRKGS